MRRVGLNWDGIHPFVGEQFVQNGFDVSLVIRATAGPWQHIVRWGIGNRKIWRGFDRLACKKRLAFPIAENKVPKGKHTALVFALENLGVLVYGEESQTLVQI